MKKILNMKKTSYGYRFALLHRLHASMCRKKILQAGIKVSMLPILLELVQETSPVTQDRLSNQIVIDKGTTARAISQLETKGFVTRVINTENRRQNLVSATEKAHRVADELFSALGDAAKILVQGFSDEEQATVLDLMDRMIANARKAINSQPVGADKLGQPTI